MGTFQPTSTKEFKQQAVKLFETSGKAKTQRARDLGISNSVLSTWWKEFGALGEEAFPVLWQDWSRRRSRRACIQLVRHQRMEVQVPSALAPPHPSVPGVLSRAQRAHARLTFAERLARNERTPTAAPVTMTLFGVPDAFATFLGLQRVEQ